MKYTLFVTCPDHAGVLKDFFGDYTFTEGKDGDTTILSFNITNEQDQKFFEMYRESLTCKKNGIKVHGVRLP